MKGARDGRHGAGPLRSSLLAALVCSASIVTAVTAQEPPVQEQELLTRRANLLVEDMTLEMALRQLQRSSGVLLAFSPDLLPPERTVTCACQDSTVQAVLDLFLEGTDLHYVASGRRILIGRAGDNGSAAPLPAALLVGRVVEEDGGRPVPTAEVRLLPGSRRTLTGADGRFVFSDVEAGDYTIQVFAFGYEEHSAPVTVRDGASQGVEIRLARAPIPLAEIRIAPGSFGVLEMSPSMMGSRITREDIEAIPQIGDDPFRTLQRLPGVAAGDVSAKLNVRGGTARDLLVRLDGLQLDQPYHLNDLDGVLGIVDVQSLGSIDLITGGFPAEFGDKWGGIFNMQTRRPPPTGTRTTLGMSLSTLSLISQGTFSDGRGQWLTSLRRGFLDIVLSLTGTDDELSPRYWDALARGQYLLSDHHVLSLATLHAGDDVTWQDQNDSGSHLQSNWTNSYAWLTWKASFTERLRAETTLSAGRLTDSRSGHGGDYDDGVFKPLQSTVFDEGSFRLAGLRQDWQLDLTEDLLLKTGFDLEGGSGEFDYFGQATRYDVDPDRHIYIRADTTDVYAEPSGHELGAYAALRGRIGGALTWETGLRYDHQSHTGDEDVAPRLLARWDPTDRTTLRASWGHYYQSQGLHELDVMDGETTFYGSERAEQVAVGIEHRLGEGLTGRVEAYSRDVADPRPFFVNLSREINPIMEVMGDRTRLDPTRGRASGLELLLSKDGQGPWSWDVSYILAKTELELDGLWVPRTLDQRHTLNLFAAYRRSRAWQFSGAWHYHTGWPVTEQFLDVVISPIGDGTRQALIIRRGFGSLNRQRLPSYHRLDLRVTRTVQMESSRLELFLDVFNVYNRGNLRGYDYHLRETRLGHHTTVRDNGEEMLPILPTVGFRWVF